MGIFYRWICGGPMREDLDGAGSGGGCLFLVPVGLGFQVLGDELFPVKSNVISKMHWLENGKTGAKRTAPAEAPSRSG